MEKIPKARERKRGRPKRDLVKTTISMNAEAMALWFKLADKVKQPQITKLEILIRDEARREGVEVSPEEVTALTGFEADEEEEAQ